MGRGGNIGVCPTCGRTAHIMQTQGVCERCWRWERWHTDPENRARQLEAQCAYQRRKRMERKKKTGD